MRTASTRAGKPVGVSSRRKQSSTGKERYDKTAKARRNKTNVVVWATLASGEDSFVDALLEVWRVRTVSSEEDQTCSWAAKRLVTINGLSSPGLDEKVKACRHSRRGSDDVTVLKRAVQFLCRDQTTRVGDIRHQISTIPIANSLERSVIPVSWVRGSTADDQTGLEYLGLLVQCDVINELRGRIETIRERLEVDGGCGHLFLGSLWQTDPQVKPKSGVVERT